MFETSDVLWIIHCISDGYSQPAGNTCKEYISLGCGVVPGLAACDTHVGLKMVDGTFHNGADFVKGDPFIRISLDTGEHTEIHVFISVSCTPLFSCAAWVFAVADPFAFDHMDFGADPFVPVGTAFFMAVPRVFHVQRTVPGAGGISVYVVADFFKSAFIPWVIGDECFGEVEILFEEAIGLNSVKSGVPKESVRVEARVQGKEILKHGP